MRGLPVPDRQTVDPSVSRSKFEREVAQFRAMEDAYRRKGWLLLDATFPEVVVAFAATKVTPPAILGAVLVDFTDYDLQPLSVRFVNPFTREPVTRRHLPMSMPRRPLMPGMPPEAVMAMIQQGMPLADCIQANGPDDLPFLCLPGVREYHDNPAHTGDPWLLHRASGVGSLAFILDKIWTYGVNPFDQYQVQLHVQVTGVMASAHAIPE